MRPQSRQRPLTLGFEEQQNGPYKILSVASLTGSFDADVPVYARSPDAIYMKNTQVVLASS
jgi:hypothetical protein